MDSSKILISIFSLIFVLCLIALASLAYKKYGSKIASKNFGGNKRRLQIREVLMIDAKKKIVLISRDDVEHLVAFGENKIEVIETNIKKAD